MKWQTFKKEGGAILAPQSIDQTAAAVTSPATADQARKLMTEIASRDPGGSCWGWMKSKRPDLWRSHMKALLDDDVTAARLSFNEMLTAWEHRHELTQADLLAA